jgi:polar amino acid transport system substrate-binding protein
MSRLFVRAGVLALAVMLAVGAAAASAAGLRAVSDVSYAPLEFYAPGSKTLEGFDVDLARALAPHLGGPVTIVNAHFDEVLRDVRSGRYDFAISAISDTRAREARVDFVDYLLAGSGMLVPAGNPKRIFDLGGLCGLRVDVEQGTSQDAALTAQSKRCTQLGLGPIRITRFATDDEAFAAFEAGKSDVHVTDYPVVVYLASTAGGGKRYEAAGREFALVPYGIAIAKNNVALRRRIVAALHAIVEDGTYDRLLKKWGLEQGALRSAPVNAGTLFAAP